MMEPTPLRPDEQVAGGFLVMRLGGQDFEVKVLPMAANRKWTAELATTVRDAVESDSLNKDDLPAFVARQAETLMDLLISYDALGGATLPEREWIDTHATDTECYEAMKRVTAAAYPFAPDLLRIAPQLLPLMMQATSRGVAAATVAMARSRSTSSSRSNTAGRQVSSKPTSPTSSSRSTPRKPRSGAKRKPSPS